MKPLILAITVMCFSGCNLDGNDYREGEIYLRVRRADNPFVPPDSVFCKIIAVKDGWYRYSLSFGDTLHFTESAFSPDKLSSIPDFYYTKYK